MYGQSKENQPKIEEIITVCPYCMEEARNKTSCCGESSCHFETAYVVDGEAILESELKEAKHV